jgi:hypothetical protein
VVKSQALECKHGEAKMSDLPHWMNTNREPVTHIPDEYYGFVYEIEYEDGKKYIGMKKIKSENMKPALKNGKEREGHIKFQNKIKKRKIVKMELVSSQSNWRSYTGSMSKEHDSPIKTRVVLGLYKTKKETGYRELEALINNKVLENDSYLNSNILGKFFKKDLEISNG